MPKSVYAGCASKKVMWAACCRRHHYLTSVPVCAAASTNGSERLRSNDSAALGTALIALDTDGAGEEEW